MSFEALVSQIAYQLSKSLAQVKKAAAEVTNQLKLGKVKEGLTSIAPKARNSFSYPSCMLRVLLARVFPPHSYAGSAQSLAYC